MTEREGRSAIGESDADERFDSIPWDALVLDDAKRRRRVAGLVGLSLVIVGGVAGALGLLRAEPASNSIDAGRTARPSVPSDPEPAPPSSAAGVAERDLVAGGDSLTDSAGAYAAWFVADYFTLDGSAITREAVLSRLPEGISIPEADGTARSFVETALPIHVTPIEGGHRVVVVVRALAALDGENYERQPVKAVEVTVATSPDGFSISDLPTPVPLPASTPGRLVVEEQEPPDEILEAARRQASQWGEPTGTIVSAGRVDGSVAGRDGGGWRVVVEVIDPGGMRWPAAMWIGDTGQPTSAGSG